MQTKLMAIYGVMHGENQHVNLTQILVKVYAGVMMGIDECECVKSLKSL